MSVYNFRAGAIKVYTPEFTTDTLGTCAGIVFSASAVDLSDRLNKDVRNELDATATYQFILTQAGKDTVKGGIAHTVSSGGSGVFDASTLTANQGILISVANAQWSGKNHNRAFGVGVWMKKNNGSFRLHGYAIPDPDNDLKYCVITEADLGAPAKTAAELMDSAFTDDEVGNTRTAVTGMRHVLAGITEDGVTIEDTSETLQYKPDTSTNFQLAISAGMSVTFSTLNNDMRDIINARRGEFAEFTSGVQFQQGFMAFQSATAVATGNVPLKMLFPVDTQKTVEEVWMWGALNVNQTGGTANWGKENPPKTDYRFDTTNMDASLQSVHCVGRRKRRSA